MKRRNTHAQRKLPGVEKDAQAPLTPPLDLPLVQFVSTQEQWMLDPGPRCLWIQSFDRRFTGIETRSICALGLEVITRIWVHSGVIGVVCARTVCETV